ncbi:MAG: hypothetical protein ACYC18_11400 [Gammaproteobacteria bacterium]|nr:hypothetical protein [Gammaproteobacteria bacterium]
MAERFGAVKSGLIGVAILALGLTSLPAAVVSVLYYLNQTNIDSAPFTDGTNYPWLPLTTTVHPATSTSPSRPCLHLIITPGVTSEIRNRSAFPCPKTMLPAAREPDKIPECLAILRGTKVALATYRYHGVWRRHNHPASSSEAGE